MKTPKWLEKATFYQIYPQSFYDSNNDGIGDLNGIKQKLDYIKWIGCNALWINPIFDSPFKDAGYDVRDYYKVAPRYGTNQDLEDLVKAAHEKGIRILLDLVPCHTSDDHEWFKASCRQEENEYTHRYIWTHDAFEKPNNGLQAVGGMKDRNGCYVISYFHSQPSLNYGFYRIDDPRWQKGMDSEEAIKTREAIIDVMRFWLSKGVDGFRVDMAACLVKNDYNDEGTRATWKKIFDVIKKEYPESAFVSEWSVPEWSLKCGFDMDFYLDHGWNGGNGYHHLFRCQEVDKNNHIILKDDSYFKTESNKSMMRFLNEYIRRINETRDDGYYCFLTNNHDMPRTSFFYNKHELEIIYSFMFLMPGVPFLYYGDEIGMKFLNVPTKEGGYYRTGARTPMQWDNSKNLGFSKASKEDIYLPVDEDKDAPTVEKAKKDPNSLLYLFKKLIELRNTYEDLGNVQNFELIDASENRKFVIYKRGNFYFLLNPSVYDEKYYLDGNFEIIHQVGNIDINNRIINKSSFVVLRKL